MKEKKKPSTIRTIAGLALWLVVIVLIFRACNKPNIKKQFDNAIASENTTFGKFSNDVTGNWRYYIYWSDNNVADRAVDYYKAYFNSDDEIHFAVNKRLKTTTMIKKLSDDMLDVSVYEYVDGEEFDAKRIPSGIKFGEYLINVKTGESEQIE